VTARHDEADAVTADAAIAVGRPDAAPAATAAGPLSILHARLDTPLAGNPTGAGDAAVAACAVLMDAGIRDPEQILRRATAWSAAAVLMPLAGEIHASWPDLERTLSVAPVAPALHAETSLPARDTTSGVTSHARNEVSPASERYPSDPKEP